MKAISQPYTPKIQGTKIGAATAPIFAPELKIPVASARSFLGNHSATVLIAAGKLPASPRPNKPRIKAKLIVPVASACNIAAILQTIMEIE